MTWKSLKKYRFIWRWAIWVLHERMGLKGKELVLWKWTFIVKLKNNSEGEALSKTKLHVISSYFVSVRISLPLSLCFWSPKSLPFIPLLFRMLSGTVYSFCFSVVTKSMGFSYHLVILWSILVLFLKIHKLRVMYFFMSFVFLQCPMIHLCRQLC